MARIEEVARQIRDETFENVAKSRILRFFMEKPDEVFRKVELTKEFKGKIPPNSVRALIAQLWREGKIGRHRLADKGFSYYGTIEAIKRLKTAISEA